MGRVPGTYIGILILATLSPASLSIGIGAMVLMATLLTWTTIDRRLSVGSGRYCHFYLRPSCGDPIAKPESQSDSGEFGGLLYIQQHNVYRGLSHVGPFHSGSSIALGLSGAWINPRLYPWPHGD